MSVDTAVRSAARDLNLLIAEQSKKGDAKRLKLLRAETIDLDMMRRFISASLR